MASLFVHRGRQPRQAYPKSLVNALGIALGRSVFGFTVTREFGLRALGRVLT